MDPDELEVQRELASYEILHLMERIAKLEEQVVVLGSGFESTTKFHKLSLLKDHEAALEALLARHL